MRVYHVPRVIIIPDYQRSVTLSALSHHRDRAPLHERDKKSCKCEKKSRIHEQN